MAACGSTACGSTAASAGEQRPQQQEEHHPKLHDKQHGGEEHEWQEHDAPDSNEVDGAGVGLGAGCTLGLLEQYLGDAIRQDEWDEFCLRLRQGALLCGARSKEPETGDSPLHLAVLYGRTRMVDRLLESGAGLCGHNRSGKTPLQLAVRDARIEIVRHIARFDPLSCGEPDLHNGWSALHYAAQYARGAAGGDIAATLLCAPLLSGGGGGDGGGEEAGALGAGGSPTRPRRTPVGLEFALLESRDGETVLDVSARHDNDAVAAAVLSRVAFSHNAMQRALALAAASGSAAVAGLLVLYGADVHLPVDLASAGSPALLLAAGGALRPPSALALARQSGHQRLALALREQYARLHDAEERRELAVLGAQLSDKELLRLGFGDKQPPRIGRRAGLRAR
jgi:ankyrin repeat protein